MAARPICRQHYIPPLTPSPWNKENLIELNLNKIPLRNSRQYGSLCYRIQSKHRIGKDQCHNKVSYGQEKV